MPDISLLEQSRDQILEKRPAYTEILNFYVRVFQAQEDIRQQICIDPVSMDPSLLKQKLENGMPLIDSADFVMDQNAAVRLLKTLCGIAGDRSDELTAAAVSLKFAIEKSRINAETLFDAVLAGDGDIIAAFSETIGISTPHLIMFAFLSMSPAIEAGADQLSVYLKDRSHDKGFCPVCGNSPDLFFLDDKGHRHLKCSFCSHCWAVARMGCIVCENRDPDTRRYFFSPEEKEYRVDVCEVCRKYIKGVDTRHMDRAFFPKLELAATLHLDFKAGEAGYSSLSDYDPVKKERLT
jgi:FdhE protein